MFADDTNISCVGVSPAKVEIDRCTINNWLEENKLTLNVKKTEFVLIASKTTLKQFPGKPYIRIGAHTID